jgi:hypothetical protein
MEDFMYLQQEIEAEEDMADETLFCQATAAAMIIYLGAEQSRLLRAERRQPSRLYLCRPQLLPNPRINTPWQRLYHSRSDRAYITTMGVNVDTFDKILESGFSELWHGSPIPRDDTAWAGLSRPGRRSLDAAGALGLVLHYLNSTMREISLQQIFALIPTTVSRYITFCLDIILETLRDMPDSAIQWPRTTAICEHYNDLIVNRHPLLDGAIASIDGLNLPVQTSNDTDIENATFNGWLAEHFISSVLVFSPEGMLPIINNLDVVLTTLIKGTIIAACLNAPGSWHDSRVAKPIYEKLRTQTPEGYYLIADTAFPRGTDDILGRIRKPLKSGQRIRGNPAEIDERLLYDRQLLSYRQTAEWGMRSMQGSFGRLRVPLEINHKGRRGNLLETCVRLHNLRTRRVGINQIRSVYMKRWTQNVEQEEVWKNFENMLFSDQRTKDRVSSYHTYVSWE